MGPFMRIPTDRTELPAKWEPKSFLKKKLNPDNIKYSFAYLADVIEPELKEWNNMTQPHVLTQQEIKDQESDDWKKVPQLVKEFNENIKVQQTN